MASCATSLDKSYQYQKTREDFMKRLVWNHQNSKNHLILSWAMLLPELVRGESCLRDLQHHHQQDLTGDLNRAHHHGHRLDYRNCHMIFDNQTPLQGGHLELHLSKIDHHLKV